MATNKKTNTASASVTNLTDNCFEPDMQDKTPLTADQKMAAFFSRKLDVRVSSAIWAFPSNGEHNVILQSWDFVDPKGGDPFFRFELKEPGKNICWRANIPAEKRADRKYDVDLEGFLNEVNAYNNGMLFGKDMQKALAFLSKREFRVWTLQYDNRNGERRCQTYSNPEQYEYWSGREAANRAAQSAKEEEYRQRKEQEKQGK